jgi:2-polyprenyl-6-methoxyphenol hydroxylase-like FAD-dependent oxidoreductase
LNQRVTLAGDAAHTAAMYRGEGLNRAIVDVYAPVQVIEHIYSPDLPNTASAVSVARERAIQKYNEEVRKRGRMPVSMCREVTMEVHKWHGLDDNSTVRKKRIIWTKRLISTRAPCYTSLYSALYPR